ncbi:MAG: DUF333 domain-containing protein [Patescibacteria group bacterium]
MKNVFTKENILTAVGLIIVVASIVYAPSLQKKDIQKNETIPSSGNTTSSNVGIANPASQVCVAYGYKLEIRKDESGGEVGYCVFPDGKECEEWQFFRNECGKDKKGGELEQMPGFGENPVQIPNEKKYAGCPKWVDCMPKIGPSGREDTCIVPPECEGYTERAF